MNRVKTRLFPDGFNLLSHLSTCLTTFTNVVFIHLFLFFSFILTNPWFLYKEFLLCSLHIIALYDEWMYQNQKVKAGRLTEMRERVEEKKRIIFPLVIKIRLRNQRMRQLLCLLFSAWLENILFPRHRWWWGIGWSKHLSEDLSSVSTAHCYQYSK